MTPVLEVGVTDATTIIHQVGRYHDHRRPSHFHSWPIYPSLNSVYNERAQ